LPLKPLKHKKAMKKNTKQLAIETKWVLDHLEMIDRMIKELEKEGVFSGKKAVKKRKFKN